MDYTMKMQRSINILEDNTNSNSLRNQSDIEKIFPEILNDYEKSTSSDTFVESSIKVMPTLSKSFKSLVDTPIDVTNDNRKPQNVIGLLGNALGVNDYDANIASFWFLDFIALQVLRYEGILDGHGMSVMVSWLAGEMKLIQEMNLARQVFFQEMAEIFIDNSERLDRGLAVLHWDLMLVNKSKEDIPMREDTEQEAKESEESTPKFTNRRVSSRSVRKIRESEDRKTFSENTSRRSKDESDNNVNDNDRDFVTSKDDQKKILDVIMEATYNMYGNSFHYALIVAAFVKPVLLHEYTLPFAFRTPRPLKMFPVVKDEKKEITEKRKNSVAPQKGKEINKKAKDSTKSKKKSKDIEIIEVIPKPPTPASLTEDEILAKKREFILPLMEANEASSILEVYIEEVNTQSKLIMGQKKKL